VATIFESVSDAELARTAGLLVRFFGAVNTLNCAMPEDAPSLSPHQVRVVMTLVKQPGRTLSELAEAVGISLGWASRVVEELEATGHVQRERDGDDRRVVRVSLTPAVQALAERMFRQRGAVVAAALAELAPAERAAVQRFLERLVDGFEGLAGGASTPPPIA
jgi:DNA-binding MarR family transcriptional regulator